ncbi:MAG TPA: PQQ-dependent dehydrogenase, methanol/ethanol family [Sphingobium sp.]|uniref:PQQ-dependent dehydrogenase, methanol/ethanol family n=1 Tax=Sphingobium sp. TaxID=1912891 RepID=UPI002ED0F7D3
MGRHADFGKWMRLPVLAVSLALAACGHGGSGASDPLLASGNWPNYGGDGRELHYSPVDEISLSNVDKLSLAWHYDLEPGFSVSAPVEADGKLFTTTGHSHIRAFDATNGKLLWDYDARTREIAHLPIHMSFGNRGLAWWKGKVYIGTTDGRVIALDANTGKQLWEQRQYGLDDMKNNNGPPRVFDGKVIVGNGGADITPERGYVTAYDAETGKQLWRFYTVPSDPSKPAESKADTIARPTWKGDWFGKGGGGTAWNAFSYDEKLGLIYIGVGNGYPYNQKLRSPGGGDNLFLSSVVAVKADTGEYVWHYQVCPAEQWDCTAVQDMSLADIKIDGKPRKVMIHAPKNGFLYVIDRETGKLISAEKIAKVTWAQKIDMKTGRPVENPGIRYAGKPGLFELWPGPQGAHSWPPQAFSPKTGLVYIPVIEMGAYIGEALPGAKGLGAGNGATLLSDADLPGSRRSFLKAWNPVTQKPAWTVELPGDWPGGVLATAGNLVFQGRIDGQLVGYDATNGKKVWSFKTAAPVVAPPISYRVGGKQYVAVLTGSGSQGGGINAIGNAAFRTDYQLPRQLLVFAIGGTDKLPPFKMPELVPLSISGFVPEPAKVMSGAMAFAGNACLVCHGMNAIGGGAAPDLRYSPAILDKDTFKSIVKGGALKPNGMPPSPQISDEMLEQIRYYLRTRALQVPADNAAIKAGKMPTVGTPKVQAIGAQKGV